MSRREERLLSPLIHAWREKIRLAREHKWRQFGCHAAEAMKFYNGDHTFLWDSTDPRSFFYKNAMDGLDCAPTFRMTYNILAELVQLFGPVMYHRNPNRQVTPRQPIEISQDFFVDPLIVNRRMKLEKQMQQNQQPGPDGQPLPPPPQFQQMMQSLQMQLDMQQDQFSEFTSQQAGRFAHDKVRAQIMQRYLNYTPNELYLKDHMREGIDETLIKGASAYWTNTYKAPGSKFYMVGSFNRTIDGFQMDPDSLRLEDCQWIADLFVEPTWLVERTYGWKRGSLKGNLESLSRVGEGAGDPWAYSFDKEKGKTNDLIAYWKIWSKMGMGGRLKGLSKDVKAALDSMGDHCHLVIADGVDQLLNAPDKRMLKTAIDELKYECQWPTPYWADSEWPVTLLEFHRVPGQLWPMSHVTPALGELRFLNFTMSFLANKMRTACDDLLGIVKGVEEDIKKVLNVESVDGYKVLSIENTFGKSVAEVCSWLQHPPFNGDIWRVIAAVAERLDKRLGLTELAYGMSARQFRSAAEVEQKQNNFSVRPDDMANKVEDVATKLARKEAIACRWHLTGEDVSAVLGQEAGMLWDQLIASSDLDEIMREFDYRIEANSTRKPNKDRDAANIQQVMQTLLPLMFQYGMQTQNWDPLNNLLRKWGDTMDMSMTDVPQFVAPPPPPPGSSPQEQEMMKLQMEQQFAQLKAQLEQASAEQKMQLDAATSQQELQQKAQEHALNLKTMLDQHRLDMAMVLEKAKTDQAIAKAKAKQTPEKKVA